MARIRSIKPEFWTSAQVMECSPMARLLFIGMWNFADDAGRMTYSTRTLKAQIYPSDDISAADVERLIVELSSNGLILLYSAEGKEIISIPGWHHQKIDKPKPSKLPGPFDDVSTTISRKVAPDPTLSEGIVSDPIRYSDASASGAEAPPDPSEAERDLFKRGRQVLGKSAGGQIANLLRSAGGNIALARSKIELAATKERPAEFIAKVITQAGAGPPIKPLTQHQIERENTRSILNDLDQFISGNGGQEDLGLLRHDPSGGPAGVHGGIRGDVVDLPVSRPREGS
jgi:hypothetical protein